MGVTAHSSSKFRPIKLPADASSLALAPDPCHCVADAELDNRYNVLRAEEHARTEGKCGSEWSTSVAKRPENASRNRYATVHPWDHSRVRLPVSEGHNDYINASWVELGSRVYIASQGPLKSTVGDFWQMVYAYGGEPTVIVMLTPLHEHAVEKCVKYWPDKKAHPVEVSSEGGFATALTIHLVGVQKFDKYDISTFHLKAVDGPKTTRTVHHVYYHSWLDYTKPDADSDLRALVHLMNNQLRNRACPPIVHCSAGIGRTGTYIALDALLSKIDTDILPAVLPRIVPMWKGDQRVLQYRKSLFTGEEDCHSDAESTSPLLSHFDVHSQHNVEPSPSSQTKSSATSHSAASSHSTASSHSAATTQAMSEMATESTIEPSRQPSVDPMETINEQLSPKDCAGVSSSKTGPVIRKVQAKVTSVSPEVFSQTPDTIDVLQWFEPSDPVMSAVRLLRQQRPKMVQGKQQLGYIYDQFEVGQQLARATFQHNNQLRRANTFTAPSQPVDVAPKPVAQKPRRFLSLIGVRRTSQDHSGEPSARTSPTTNNHRLRGLFGHSK